jgi:hypothetical protein
VLTIFLSRPWRPRSQKDVHSPLQCESGFLSCYIYRSRLCPACCRHCHHRHPDQLSTGVVLVLVTFKGLQPRPRFPLAIAILVPPVNRGPRYLKATVLKIRFGWAGPIPAHEAPACSSAASGAALRRGSQGMSVTFPGGTTQRRVNWMAAEIAPKS